MPTMTAMDAAVKRAIVDYGIQQTNVNRNVAAMTVLSQAIWNNGGLMAVRTRKPWVHVWRTVLIPIISYTWFFALGRMKLPAIASARKTVFS